MASHWRSGFTLVELLVVIAIIAMAMGLIATSMGRVDKDATVRQAAESLAGTLRKARSMAMADNMPYAVAFNIQNEPGSSGRVLNNRSGGHWYRILGPTKAMATGHGEQQGPSGRRLLIPYVWDATFNTYSRYYPTFPQYCSALNECWIGERIALPAKKVRFLALSETDEGYRVHGEYPNDTTLYVDTYPRPYFGYFDTTRNRLFPWGGYDHDLGEANPWSCVGGQHERKNYTGFFYEGRDGRITGCVNPIDRAFDVDWNLNDAFAGADALGRNEIGYKVLVKDAPRPLVNAEWGDYLVCFTPDGDAYVPPFGVGRKRFADYQSTKVLPSPGAQPLKSKFIASGVMDMTRTWVDAGGFHDSYDAYSENTFSGMSSQGSSNFVATSEMGHFVEHTGGWHISLASDVLNDNDTFASSQEAMRSLLPIHRVFISRRGEVSVVKVTERDDSWLAAQAPWPTAQSSFSDFETLRNNLRFGWLNSPHPNYKTSGNYDTWPTRVLGVDWWWGPEFSNPRGQAISYHLTPAMLARQQWWSDK
jgi:prepilin-type N-terminal cleavage/methylation domain-containing protein